MATQSKPPPAPLFPQPLPVIGVSGEFGSGKTLFMATICPGPGTLIYDFEKSSQSYMALRFDRIDAYTELLKSHPGGAKGPQLWEWWRDHVKGIKPGRYRVIAIDTVTPIEDALGEWVMQHAADFGRTKRQYVNNMGQPTGLYWGDMKSVWEATLNDLAARCEVFAFAAHMSTVYAGNAPTLKRKAKGKVTLFQLSSLYLEMERKADAKGVVPAEPAARVLKQRAIHAMVHPDTGKLAIVPALPPRLPVATPDAIRAYMLAPPDYRNLQAGEVAPEEHLTDDDRAELAVRKAEAEAEMMRGALAGLEDIKAGRMRPASEVFARLDHAARHDDGIPPRPATAPAPVSPPAPHMGDPVTHEQLDRLVELRAEFFWLAEVSPEEQTDAWLAILDNRGVTSATALSRAQAAGLIDNLAFRNETIRMERQTDGRPTEPPPDSEDAPTGGSGG